MRSTYNLNLSATSAMNGMTKVRVKNENGKLFIKPTDRVCGKNLPKGEKLVKLSVKNPNRASSLVKFGLRGDINGAAQAGQTLKILFAARGWIELVPSDSTEGLLVKVSRG